MTRDNQVMARPADSLGRWCTFAAAALVVATPLLDRPAEAGSANDGSAAGALTWLDVATLDRKGQPVVDLNQDDFQVLDNGKRQRIVFFRPPESMRPPLPPGGPHEFGNRSQPGVSPATVILLDLLNARFAVRAAGWNEIVHALQHLKSPDSFYLYLLSIHGVLHPVHPLSPMPAGSRPPGPSWTANIEDVLNRLMREESGLRSIEEQDPGVRTTWTYKALSELEGSMAAIPGRKSLVWISHGVPLQFPLIGDQWYDSTPHLRELSANFARARIAVYTVDQWADVVGRPGSLSTDTLDRVSALTGGRAYASDLTEVAITEAIGDARACYVIGYFPQLQKLDGKYHKVRVIVDRPSVRTQTREGYYADRALRPADARTAAALRHVAAQLSDDPGIGLRAALSSSDDPPAAIRLRIRVDPADLLLSALDRRYSGQIELAVAAYTDEGPRELVAPTPLDLDLTEEQRDKGVKDGLELIKDLPLGGKLRAIRVFVVDRRSGASGSVTIPIAAPPPC